MCSVCKVIVFASLRCGCMQFEATMAFLLPHECLAVIHSYSDVEVLSDRQELDKVSLEHLQQAEAASGQNLLALGLWGDGVPFTWARDQSMETWVWFLPGVGHETWKGARFPFTCFPTSSVGSTTTSSDPGGLCVEPGGNV